MTLYHQKQIGSYCRLHALNNLIGRELATTSEFDKFCDEFDKKNKFEVMCSRNSHEFYNTSDIDSRGNIFGYTLAKKGINVKMIGYEKNRKGNITNLDTDDLLGAIILNPGHTFSVRYDNSKWFVIDSMNGSQPEVSISYFNNKAFGFLMIYRDLDIMNKLII